MTKPVLAALGAVLAVGCSGGASGYKPSPAPKIEPVVVKPGTEQDLFPFKVGNSWTYSFKSVQRAGNRSQPGSGDLTFKVTKIEENGGNTRITLDLILKDKAVDKQVWVSNSKGIYQSSLGMTKVRSFDTPIPAITFPVDKDKKFSWSGSDGKAKMAYNCLIIGPEEVDTEEKRMSAIAVESKGTSTSGDITEKTDRKVWFAPGIGIVRLSETTVSNKGSSELLLILKSHTVK